jgi:hypothetical protein
VSRDGAQISVGSDCKFSNMAGQKKSDLQLRRAFDSVRFGAANILNLRESLPTVAEATRRAELWIRQRQVEGAEEVLVISGRGNGSEGGISPVREGIIKLIASLRRRGVIDRYEEHTAGSFSIQLASMQSMIDAPRRHRDRRTEQVPAEPDLAALPASIRHQLRELAERSLDTLGVKETSPFVEGEMLRQLVALRAALPEGPEGDAQLPIAIKNALDQTI